MSAETERRARMARLREHDRAMRWRGFSPSLAHLELMKIRTSGPLTGEAAAQRLGQMAALHNYTPDEIAASEALRALKDFGDRCVAEHRQRRTETTR